jgi:HK97 family phage prohead protease
VHGNIDDGLDRSHPGAFAKTFAEGARRIKFLWMHNPYDPPTAVIKALRELRREELPAAVLTVAPAATGGAEVVREYLETPRGEEILTGIKAGAISELSYGYDPLKWDMSKENDRQIRELRELRLWDISDVTWGMNPATVGSKLLLPVDLLLAQLQAAAADLKAGRRDDAQWLAHVEALHGLAVELGARNCLGIGAEAEGSRAADDDSTHSLALTVARLEITYLKNIARGHGVAV